MTKSIKNHHNQSSLTIKYKMAWAKGYKQGCQDFARHIEAHTRTSKPMERLDGTTIKPKYDLLESRAVTSFVIKEK